MYQPLNSSVMRANGRNMNRNRGNVGRIVFDELKLKQGCVWNTSNGRLSEFIKDECTSSALRDQMLQ